MRGLVLAAGGSAGAYEAGAVYALAKAGARFDVVAGASVGALNAAFLAQYGPDHGVEAAGALIELWRGIRRQHVYRHWLPFGPLHAPWRSSLYCSAPLRLLINRTIESGLVAASPTILFVRAVDLETGEGVTIRGDDPDLLAGLAGSAAIPGVFEPVRYRGRWLVDGGTRDIAPVRDLMACGCDEVIVVTPHSGHLAHTKVTEPRALEVARRGVDILMHEVHRTDIPAGCVRIIAPSAPLEVDSLAFDRKVIRHLLDLGRRDGDASTRCR